MPLPKGSQEPERGRERERTLLCQMRQGNAEFSWHREDKKIFPDTKANAEAKTILTGQRERERKNRVKALFRTDYLR